MLKRRKDKCAGEGQGEEKEMKQKLAIVSGVIIAVLIPEWLTCMPGGMLNEKFQRL